MSDKVWEQYRDFMHGKDVVIVGGADNYPKELTQLKKNRVVVRVNSHCHRQGGERDVIYHTTIGNPNVSVEMLEDYEPNYIWLNIVDGDWDYDRKDEPTYLTFQNEIESLDLEIAVGYFTQGEWEGENPYGPQYEWLNELHKKYNCKLFTGMVALAHVMMTEARTITVAGMDMFIADKESWEDGQRHSHNLEGNVMFLFSTLKDRRVILDFPLLEALEKACN